MFMLARRHLCACAAVIIWTFSATLAGASNAATLQPSRLQCELRANPESIDTPRPRLSWVVTSAVRGDRQTAYRVLVASRKGLLNGNRGDLWDTGKVASDETLHIEYNGRPLRSRMECWWKVRVWDRNGKPSAWSEPARWAMGLMKPSDWRAQWIGCAVDRQSADDLTYLPAPLFRREFVVREPVRRAVIYASAAGLYELWLNGRRVGRDYFTPGWTEYHRRLYYQAYDVTSMLRPRSTNALGAVLGDGWYGLHHHGRGRLALKAQLHIEYASGRTDTVVTDRRWKTTDRSPIRMSDIYNGETYDARLAMAGWSNAGFHDASWRPVVVHFAGQTGTVWKDVTEIVRAAVKDNRLTITASNEIFGDPIYGVVKTLHVRFRTGLRVQERRVSEGATLTLGGGNAPLAILKAEYGADTSEADVGGAVLQAHPGSPVRKTGVLRPVRVTEPRAGTFVFDMGQNFSGWVRLKVHGPRGTAVTLRFAEMLNPDGTIYTANLRNAKCTDRYILSGQSTESWEPRFTFHGFRYVEVTGYPGRPRADAVTGVVVHSDCGITGEWRCSDPLLNRLYQNIVWGQRSNYLEVPTDCPQRDERMGWSGDAQVFVGTGAYCMHVAPFFAAWMRTFNDSQSPEGAYPNVAPRFWGVSPAWGDAGLICPWTVYTMYGDRRILSDHYAGMRKWVEYLRERSKDYLRPAEGYGDWLNVADPTPKEVISTAFFAHAADLLSRMAAVLGKTEDQTRYRTLYRNICSAFTRAFVSDGSDGEKIGTIRGNSQTGYLLALEFDLLPGHLRKVAFERLVENLQAHDFHLTVGFVGVDHLLPVLSRYGRDDLAWRLLTNKTYPSWLYSVTQGATTIWERWDGWRHDRGFQDPGMNSFNHYAFGACGKWMFSRAAGISTEEPGWKRIVVHPVPGDKLSWLKARYDSVRGPVVSEWRRSGQRLTLSVTIPSNCIARVFIPTRSAENVRESGKPVKGIGGIRLLGMAQGCAVYEVGGGSYTFETTAP